MFSLQNKVTVVTGAASGIGAAIAESFARAGALVYVADCNEAGGEAMVRQIEQQGGQAKLAVADLAKEADCQGLAQRVLIENGNRCDVLVNNAGVGHVGSILTTEPAELERLWQINVKGMYFLSRAILPAMIERRSGSIINLASVAGVMGMEARFAYTVTKHAVVGMTRAMAMDHGQTGVRINCICPGRTQTPFVQARLQEYPNPQEYLKQMVAPHALKRLAQPWEIAAAAVYLASDEAAFVTGSAMVVDGGYMAGK
jgi:NAD(P)-dependent dehydrogenase (short-subunit alcohol dehydrogenase family)